jgi:hypothetical protein
MELDCLRLFEILEDYSKIINKALLIIIPAWENETEELKSEVIYFYKDKMPEEIVNSLVTGQIRIIKYDNFDLAVEDAETYFPPLEAIEEINPKYKIKCWIINELGQACWQNT